MGERSPRADREVTDPAVQPAGAAATTKKRGPNRVVVTWKGDERFDTGRPGGPVARIDGKGETGQGPVDALLSSLASCSSIDVVGILAKRRTPVERLEVEVIGKRVESVPRRLEHVLLRFRIAGEGIERVHAERAIDLAINRYCSVRDSLDRGIPIEWELELQG